MWELVSTLFSTDGFPARWHCGSWTTVHGWVHIISDILIFTAYLTIPLIIAYLTLKRRIVPFPRIAWLFVAFIFACGTTHLIESIIFWHPIYRISGLVKFITAGVSIATVFALIPTVPRLLELRSPSELEREIKERTAALAQRTAELQRSNADLEQFAYVASHDLKAPLRAILHLSQWIEEEIGTAGSPKVRDHLELLRMRAHRMETLLNSLLDYCRVGRDMGQIEYVDISALVEDIKVLLDVPKAFTVVCMSDTPQVQVRRTPLQQVLLNLINNAIKHHHRTSGQIVIRATTNSSGAYEFSVQDDGPGIATEYCNQIFQMFQTLRPRDEIEGAGMGLAIVKKTVEYHGGSIWVESKMGVGSTFRFTWAQEPAMHEGGR